jgi:hypothetical protein
MPKRPIHTQHSHKIVQPAMNPGARRGYDHVLGKWRGIVAEIGADQPMLA